MKRIRTVVYGRFGESSSRGGKEDTTVCERLRPQDFAVSKSFRYGFPHQPTCVAVDSVQGILAIGTYTGSLRILGRPGVEAHVQHEGNTPVRNLRFLINEGALISTCPEDSIHLWNLRQAQPVIVQSLRFNRERITCLHLPFTSKWMFVGTEKGNIHIVNIERFDVSGYSINWNKAIDIQCKTHPGPVVQISDNPIDSNKILLGYESGMVVLWSLRSKTAELRVACPQKSLTSFHWFNDGKQFICSHTDGTLSIWNIKGNSTDTLCPNGKTSKETRPCAPITKVQWLSPSSGEPLILFSGGTTKGKRKGLTLCQGKTTKLLSPDIILDFTTILSSPWKEDAQIPRAVIAVTTSRLLVYDLMTSLAKPLAYDVPYTFEIHESPVTCTQYFSDCPPDLIADLGSLASRLKKRNLTREASRQAWPILGGVSGEQPEKPPSELIITGHADGTVKFWDSSSASLILLYKMSTVKLFEKEKGKSSEESSDSSERKPSTSEGSESGERSSQDEDPEAYSIQMIHLCEHSRILLVAGAAHVLVMSFSMNEKPVEFVQIDLNLTFESSHEQPLSPEPENAFMQPGDRGSTSSPEIPSHTQQPIPLPSVSCKTGMFKRHPGFQAELACVISNSHDGWPVSNISLSSQLGIISICSGPSLALVDIVQKKLITTLSAHEMTSLAESPSNAPPTTPMSAIPMTPGTPGTPISLTLNLEAGGGLDFSEATVNKLEKKRNKPPRPAPPMVRSKSQAKSGDPPNGAESSEGGAGSRQRASYPSSGDGGPPDTVQCTKFAYTYTKKNDNWISPCLFVGTAKGNTFIVVINMPSAEERLKQPILTIITGTVFRPKSGLIMTLALLDNQGHLFPSPLKFWSEKKNDNSSNKTVLPQECSDRHFLVTITEREAKVFQLPPAHSNPNPYSKTAVADDTSVVLIAEVIVIEGSSCLICLTSTGQLMAFSLPSLTTLMSAECSFLLTDFRYLRTLKFSEGGQAIVMCSPYEIQKLSVFTRNGSSSDSLGTLFRALETPEKPSQGFFSSLFSSQASPLDREQLFGKESGAASRSVAERMQGPGIQQLQEVSIGLAGAMQKNREALAERGEKLSQLDKKTAELSLNAQNFADVASQITLKYKEKKWYQV
ncbi:syntaxin-binding protein 5-like isoform X2 [Actinia tenebrosa]|uniref:Syntaxin-binding protein 5-like isoform X2 n=1 Tax=Actinia tenebrosa TaxID=6105 RepID=A0A6P8J7I7_ACTTE|nr:syntaxin-binding protein 5-like isoform X2 [Actinia tenebrosa]